MCVLCLLTRRTMAASCSNSFGTCSTNNLPCAKQKQQQEEEEVKEEVRRQGRRQGKKVRQLERENDEEKAAGVEHRQGKGEDAGKVELERLEKEIRKGTERKFQREGKEQGKVKRRAESRVREVPKEAAAKKRVDSGLKQEKLQRFLSKAIQLCFGLCPAWAKGAMGELGEMSILTCHKSVDTWRTQRAKAETK